MSENIIPEQNEGASSDTENSVSFLQREEAVQFYEVVKARMQDVNHWNKYAGESLADFTLLNSKGEEVSRLPEVNDYFKIDVPGIGNPSGDGYDFVQIQEVKDITEAEESCFYITVQPAPSPLNTDKDVAHFFTEKASSTFIVRLNGNTVYAEVHGRNELPNIKGVDLNDTLRNTLVATGGVLGFSKLQWSALTKGLIERTTDK